MKLDRTKLSLEIARQGLNLTRLAKASDVSRATLSYVYNGKSCSPAIAGRIAGALGVDVAEIIEGVKG